MTDPVLSVVTGNNGHLIAEVARLHTLTGKQVADVTYGKGVFWRKMDLSTFTLLTSDLETECMINADFRHLPYADASLDVVVLDPPYIHSVGHHVTDSRYNNRATTKGMYHADIINLYREGMVEASRVLKGSGSQLWVKCKDQVQSAKQCWSHIDLYSIAVEEGLFARDLFVLVPTSRTAMGRWTTQAHARKVHSYLWVFEKR